MKAICPGGSSAMFFDYPSLWEKLKNETIPDIIRKKEGSVLRIWAGNCSTGEWVYTLLIVFLEVIEEMRVNIQLKIFASDIDPDRVKIAEQGFYLQNIGYMTGVSGVSKERLERFFNKKCLCRGYQVKPEVRELIEFSTHDLIDEPYPNIDFLYCRWLLQWFPLEVKEKFIARFMESIVPGGVLFLDDKVYYRKAYR
jgi:two-component system CheB/CheR fusion protein